MNTQTIPPADVWEIAKTALVWFVGTALPWLAGIGIVIDLTPGIKIQPVRWLIKQLGNLLNHDMKEQITTLQAEFEDHKVDSWRYEILDFANSCMNHRRHTKEEFDHVIDTCDKYKKYIEEHKMKNGQVDVAEEFIKDLYRKCMQENDFIIDPAKMGGKQF